MTDQKILALRAAGINVIGKIVLPGDKKTATKKVAKKHFKPFFGGYTIGEVLKAQGISLG
ncbi:MAG: hypothetical protein V4439_02200 [Patescibacteria group bacterium]